MGVFNGQPVDQAITNPAFIDANADDQAQGKIDFVNTDPVSGPSVFNIQKEMNALNSFTNRPAGSVYNVLPVWTSTQAGSTTDNLQERAEALTVKFDPAVGHTHDGSAGNGPQISAPSLTSVPLKGYVLQGANLLGVTGTTDDVSANLTGQTPSNSSTQLGVVVNSPYNTVVLRQATGSNQGDPFTNGSGDIVYGRLTNAGSVWTLSFYVNISGTETAYNFSSSSDIAWYYQELFNPMVNPPVYSEFANIPSDNPTQDVVVATTTVKGKVQLATTIAAIAASGTAGTPNATVANADHTHEGVHAIKIDGDPTTTLGDVSFQAGSGITLAWVGGKLQVNSTGGAVAYQEVPTGTVNGSNTTFGPLTFSPSDVNSVLVFVDYVAIPAAGYSISGNSVVFNAGWIPQTGQSVYVFYVYSGSPSVPVVSGQFRVEYRTVTSGEEIAKSLSLAFTPATPSYVLLDAIGGGPQIFGTDFTVSGSTLSWSGLGLDGVVVAGDVLRLSYVT